MTLAPGVQKLCGLQIDREAGRTNSSTGYQESVPLK